MNTNYLAFTVDEDRRAKRCSNRSESPLHLATGDPVQSASLPLQESSSNVCS